MNAAKYTSGFLSAGTTLALLELIGRRQGGESPEQVLRDLAATTQLSWSRARDTIRVLISFEFLIEDENRISIKPGDHQESIQDSLARKIADELVRRIDDHNAWQCLSRRREDGMVMLDSMTIPAITDGLGAWVIEFGIASRHSIEDRFWSIDDKYLDIFERTVRKANRKRPRRAKAAIELQEDLARQAAAGKKAEEWVVEFERSRLAGHPCADQVRRVSEEDVAAGYDIISFSSLSSVHHDLFIEVKSFSKQKRFYWSRNEICTAIDFGEQYCLYLVDRTKTSDPSYAPHIISGPTPDIFSKKGSGWLVSATSFEHIAIEA